MRELETGNTHEEPGEIMSGTNEEFWPVLEHPPDEDETRLFLGGNELTQVYSGTGTGGSGVK